MGEIELSVYTLEAMACDTYIYSIYMYEQYTYTYAYVYTYTYM